MIPEFDEYGYLPPGIHLATLEEVVQRFGHGSDNRDAEGQSLQWPVPMCRRAAIVRLILNGSFVTDCAEPGDVDCILVAGPRYDRDSDAAVALEFGLPYLSLQIVAKKSMLEYFLRTFGCDRAGVTKGLVEIIL